VLTLPEKTPVVLAGMVTEIKMAKAKDGTQYANFTLEDFSGGVRSIMWSNIYDKFPHLIKSDIIVCMRGKMSRRKSVDDTSPDGNFVPDEAWAIDMDIMLDEERHSAEAVSTLMKILQENPGNGVVELSLRLKSGAVATFNGRRITAGVTPTLQQQITEFLGTHTTRVGEKIARAVRR
jgi:DNA polymerase-3 subunit alpha